MTGECPNGVHLLQNFIIHALSGFICQNGAAGNNQNAARTSFSYQIGHQYSSSEYGTGK